MHKVIRKAILSAYINWTKQEIEQQQMQLHFALCF